MNLPRPDNAILQQAAHWYARLRNEPQARAAWLHWYEQDDRHRQAWRYVERISQRFDTLQGESDLSLQTLTSARRSDRSRRQVLGNLAVVSGGLLLGWLMLDRGRALGPLLAWNADYRTATGEVRDVTLKDGTRVWLNSASALNVDYRSDLRHLQLLAGEVLIETGKDQRPFIVETAEGRMRALGTRFSVQQREEDTLLNVYDGAVQVHTAATGASRVVPAGQQLRFDRQQWAAPQPAAAGRQSWSKGVLLASDITLADFAAELSRYRHGHLGVDASVAQLRVMGSYPLDDPEQALAMLESVLPIRIRRSFAWWVNIEAR